MKIWVTGASGQVGSELVDQANERGHDVRATGRKDLDISSASQVYSFAENSDFDVIINAAAYTAVDSAEDDPIQAYQVNAEAVKFLANAAFKLSIPLLHISTDYVFDGTKQSPYKESDPVAPINVYGASKLKGEEYLIASGAKFVTLRTSWVFGLRGNNFVKTMLRLSNERAKFSVVSDQVGAPVYAPDIANALLRIAERSVLPSFVDWGIYHYSGQSNVSWWGFADYIVKDAYAHGVIESLPEIAKIDTKDYRTPAKRPLNSTLDNGKIQEVFAIACSDWKSGVRIMNTKAI